jgi:hypothetical protein
MWITGKPKQIPKIVSGKKNSKMKENGKIHSFL